MKSAASVKSVLRMVCLVGVSTSGIHAQVPLTDPILVNPGGTWPQNTGFNPARNEYLVAFRSGVPQMKYNRLNSAGAIIGSATTIVDSFFSGVHEGVVAYNSVNAEWVIAYSGWLDVGGGNTQDGGVRIQRINSSTGALIGAPNTVLPNPTGGVFEMNIGIHPPAMFIWSHGMRTSRPVPKS